MDGMADVFECKPNPHWKHHRLPAFVDEFNKAIVLLLAWPAVLAMLAARVALGLRG